MTRDHFTLKTIGVMQNWFEFVHYSRLPLCITAMTLTAASGKVLVGQIEWQPALIVGLGSYVTYSLDNLVDWPGEKHLLEAIKRGWNVYLIWCIFTISLALAGTLLLAVQSTFSFLTLLTGFGIISATMVFLTRQSGGRDRSIVALWAERLIVSLTWALVCVLVPVQYADRHIVAQVIMAVAYVWHLSWVSAMVWDLTSPTTRKFQHRAQTLSGLLGEYHLIRLLQIASVLSLVLAVVDILLGYFPWYNLSVISAPIANFVLLSLWNRLGKMSLLYGNLFLLANTLCSLLVIVVYVIAEQGFP